jgi:tetratricopeptide (TPR) repeat protein
MDSLQKRFRVALSYPGEHREFVGRVAERLSERLGRERVLYDKYHEAEFARIDLDTYLQRLYHDESELIVVFFSENYERKEWPGLEWRAIRDVIKQRRESTVIPVRFDDTEIPGLFSTAGSLWVGDREPEVIADLVLQRLHLESGTTRDARDGAAGAKLAPPRLRHSAEKLIGREDELARLDAAWTDPTTHVLTIVAFGGVGKTSLVAHWAAGLAQRDFDGASYFDWSFYSQGTREQGGASADQFINRALEFFGDPELAAGAASPWDKGARLAQLVAERRALLVLDGLEPLQYPPGPLAGELRDPAIAALLKGLAQRNPGLCVVTTRERVSDLTSFRSSTAPELPLHHLSKPAGMELLRTVGVQGREEEFKGLVEEVRGHALTLNLLGRYLVRAHSGDIRKRDRVRFEKADASIQGGHAFKAMAAYERWLGEGGEEGARQLAILQLMGLFDRPADAGCLEALRRPPVIAGLTEAIVDVAEEDWNVAVAALGDCGLVSKPEEAGSGAIDAHPLIREYFAKRLRDHAPEAWREAHSRLYEHLRDSVEYQPDTLDGLQPLYQAVAHGCHARRYQEVCESVFQDRIVRGDEFYSTKQLGASGADLGAVACFFDPPWIKVSPFLTAGYRAWCLDIAAFILRALGRLSEARQPMRAGLDMRIEQDDWNNAARGAGNLSELEMTLGNVGSALVNAERAVALADRNGDGFLRVSRRATHAGALHQAGRGDEALALFREAEALHAKRQPHYPLLYSLSGFLYCDLLLSQSERTAWQRVIGLIGLTRLASGQSVGRGDDTAAGRNVEKRAVRTLEWAEDNKRSILDIANHHLMLGRALLYESIVNTDAAVIQQVTGTKPLIDPAAAQNHLGTAVAGLRRAGHMDHLPRGLLSRAWLRFLQGDDDGARTDLDEAWEIAERGPMRLHMADIHLYRARLFRAVKPYPWDSPHADLAAARKLIEECGYWRRKEELEDAEAAAKNW